MSEIYCERCKPGTRKSCKKCGRYLKPLEVKNIISRMTDIDYTRIYGRHYFREDLVAKMTKVFSEVLVVCGRKHGRKLDIPTPETSEEYQTLVEQAADIFRALVDYEK